MEFLSFFNFPLIVSSIWDFVDPSDFISGILEALNFVLFFGCAFVLVKYTLKP